MSEFKMSDWFKLPVSCLWTCDEDEAQEALSSMSFNKRFGGWVKP